MAVQAGLPSFYIYSGEVYDQTGLLECWPSWPYEDQAAEVRMLMQLWPHPQRVLSPESAELFVVPVLPYISLLTGECLGRTHEARMSLVADALQHSQYFMRSGGRDHLVVSNTFRTVAFRALKPLLVNATFGWFEDPAVPRGGPNTLYRQAFWRSVRRFPSITHSAAEHFRSSGCVPNAARTLHSAAWRVDYQKLPRCRLKPPSTPPKLP
eukprot:6185009-Pleurochrysis_carterae.AAC.1